MEKRVLNLAYLVAEGEKWTVYQIMNCQSIETGYYDAAKFSGDDGYSEKARLVFLGYIA